MQEKENPVPSQFSQLGRLRTTIRLNLIGFLIFSFLLVNIIPQYFSDIRLLNTVLIVSFAYAILYVLLLSRFLKSPVSVYLGALSLAFIFAIFIQLTGGNDSIFIGYLYFFVTLIGLSAGMFPLIFMGLAVEGMFIYFFFASGGFVADASFASLLRNTVLNATTFVGGFLVMKEFVLRSKQYSEIESMTKQQELINKEKDEIIAVVSHEFRTPLAAIKGYLELLTTKAASVLSEEQKGFVKKIQVNVGRLQAIIENTLNVSVYEAGTMSLFLQPVDFEKLVMDTVNNTLLFEAEDKKIYLKLELPATRLPLISADPQRLKQVVINLVENAVKYTEKGGVTVTLSQEQEWVSMVVVDTGKGIDPKDLPYLFQKFYRGGDYKTRTIQGAGLGLYITKKLTEKHHGTLEIKSDLNKGTAVTLRLPIPKENETWS